MMSLFTKIIAGLGMLVILLVGVLVVSPMIYNNFLLEKYFLAIDRNMQHLGIHVVHYEKNLGLLRCCSNHMDIEILVAFNSAKTVDKLHHDLEKTDIKSPFTNDNYFVLYKKINGEAMIYENNQFVEVEDKERINKIMREHASHYLVEYGDQTFSGFSMWDYRAH